MYEIVINPYGATGGSLKMWERIQPVFEECGHEYNVHFSSETESITDIVRKLSVNPCDLFIIGGDGTLNQAINGIVNFENVRLSMISVGSGNDFARSQNYDKDPVEHVRKLLSGNREREIDVGEVIYHNHFNECEPMNNSHRRFIISAGIGFDAAICHEVGISKYKKVLNKLHMGKLIYIFTAVHIIATTKRVKGTIRVDNRTDTYDELLLSVVMNEPYEGGGIKFCPKATDNDNQLDICIADHLSQFDFFRIFPYAYSGAHTKFKGITSATLKKAEIETAEPMWVHTDGETPCMSSHITICLHTGKLKLMTY